MKKVPRDPDILYSSDEELAFVEYYIDKQEKEKIAILGKMLGVMWDRDSIRETAQGGIVDNLFIPLSMFLKSDITDIVKKTLGQETAEKFGLGNENIVQEMGDLPEEEFKKLLGIFDKQAKD